MNTIILIILTIVFLLFMLIGIFFMHDGLPMGASIAIILFMVGAFVLFYLGSTLIGDDIYTKDYTTCSYTVGKNDQVCIDTYKINLNYTFPTISNKVGLGYFIIDTILVIVMIREFLFMILHAGDCRPQRY